MPFGLVSLHLRAKRKKQRWRLLRKVTILSLLSPSQASMLSSLRSANYRYVQCKSLLLNQSIRAKCAPTGLAFLRVRWINQLTSSWTHEGPVTVNSVSRSKVHQNRKSITKIITMVAVVLHITQQVVSFLSRSTFDVLIVSFRTVSGNYNINILYEGKHITGSPFHAAVRADLDTHTIRCYGPGLEPNGVYSCDDRKRLCNQLSNHLLSTFFVTCGVTPACMY